jgi:splicing factor 3B subunit 3
MYALCGRGPRSALRVLRHGLTVSEMAAWEPPGTPTAVWTVRGRSDEAFDRYIVVSFVNATLVLQVGEQVEEIADSGILGSTPTLAVSLLGDDAILQVRSFSLAVCALLSLYSSLCLYVCLV